MQTYTHFIYTTAVRKLIQKRGHPLSTVGFQLGSVAPDVPLMLITIGYIVQRRWFGESKSELFDGRFDENYFHNPVWITAHNIFHAPILLIGYMTVGYLASRIGFKWGFHLIWFAIGCAFHSLLDIPTHHNDGPLLLFPLDWKTRYLSPLSYWHPDYWGGLVRRLEHLSDLFLLAVFLLAWLVKRGR